MKNEIKAINFLRSENNPGVSSTLAYVTNSKDLYHLDEYEMENNIDSIISNKQQASKSNEKELETKKYQIH